MNNNQISYKGVTVERLLDYLSDKTLSRNCELSEARSNGRFKINSASENWIRYGGKSSEVSRKAFEQRIEKGFYTIIGHPVFIGDVLEKVASLKNGDSPLYRSLIELGQSWQSCGFNKSLNEILSRNIWQCWTCEDDGYTPTEGRSIKDIPWTFRDKNTQALFEFLVNTFYDELK